MKIRRVVQSIFSQSSIIPWMMFVAIVPMILISIFSYGIAKATFHQSINNTLKITIQKKIEVIDNYIRERKLDVIQISDLPELAKILEKSTRDNQVDIIERKNILSLANYLYHYSNKVNVSNIYIFNTSGKVVFTLFRDQLLGATLTGAEPQEKDLYRAFDGARVLRLPYLSTQYNESNSTDSYIYLSNPISDAGIIKAILVLKLGTDEIARVIDRSLGYGKSEETFLATEINNEPVIFMRAENQLNDNSGNNNAKILRLLARAIKGESGEPQEINHGTKQTIAIFHYVPQLDMGMLIQYDKNEMFEKINGLKLHMIFLIFMGLLFVAAIVFWISRALWRANIKSELLLQNILPIPVIQEIKDKKQFIARNVQNVSIIFADIVKFTQFASTTPPETVVKRLDDIFSLFDRLCDKYQLEKIKTIGDAYMATAGLIFPQDDHANRIVDFGIDMVRAIKHYNIDHQTNFSLRIGIDSGTITAGVIGKRKFSYDLWGNAVNRASRMEATGIENVIQITHETYQALQYKENYKITARKEVLVKGLGKMDTYLIEDKISTHQ